MKKYPGRVYSKPQFVYIPPFVHTGAEFALIPSRDEPFGLVSVEFGRKGALGIGARVGGLGQMPGWWFSVESSTTKHLLTQFKKCINGALASDHETRALLRARSKVQRFPVQQWVEDLEALQTKAIKLNHKVQDGSTSALNTPFNSLPNSRNPSRVASPAASRQPSPSRATLELPSTSRAASRPSSPSGPASRPSSPTPVASRSHSPNPETSGPQMRRRLSSLLYPAHPSLEKYLPFRRRLSSLFPATRRTPFQDTNPSAPEEEDESRDSLGELPRSPPRSRPGTSG
ncbi:alpha-1,3-glucan synthase, partial [Aureobasidium melanogenum]